MSNDRDWFVSRSEMLGAAATNPLTSDLASRLLSPGPRKRHDTHFCRNLRYFS